MVEEGVDVVVLDATDGVTRTSQAIAELEAIRPEVGIVVVSECSDSTRGTLGSLPKWGPLQRLADEIGRTYLRLQRHGRGTHAGSGPGGPEAVPARSVDTTT